MITERLLGTALRCIEFFEDAFETILLLEWCSCAELHVRFLACRRGRISGEHYGAPSRVVVWKLRLPSARFFESLSAVFACCNERAARSLIFRSKSGLHSPWCPCMQSRARLLHMARRALRWRGYRLELLHATNESGAWGHPACNWRQAGIPLCPDVRARYQSIGAKAFLWSAWSMRRNVDGCVLYLIRWRKVCAQTRGFLHTGVSLASTAR
jgi:hypothetical protein